MKNKREKNQRFFHPNFLRKNRKGTDKMLSMYWFVVLIIVAAGIFAMVYNFYAAPYDVRETEANILTNKVADCISSGGRIDSEFFKEGGFSEEIKESFLEKCSLNFEVEDELGWREKPQYFFEVEFYEIGESENSVFDFYEGNIDYKLNCFIKKKNDKDYEKMPKCVERRFYALGENDEQYLIKILSGIGKLEKNVKL